MPSDRLTSHSHYMIDVGTLLLMEGVLFLLESLHLKYNWGIMYDNSKIQRVCFLDLYLQITRTCARHLGIANASPHLIVARFFRKVNSHSRKFGKEDIIRWGRRTPFLKVKKYYIFPDLLPNSEAPVRNRRPSDLSVKSYAPISAFFFPERYKEGMEGGLKYAG